MAGRDQYKAQQFIEAIRGSGGIISTIAKRVGCSWHTAKKYIDNYATVKQAYDDEREVPVDWAESVVIRNIALALKKQEETSKPVDSSDAKWLLVHKGKERGYVRKEELDLTTGGKPLYDIEEWKEKAKQQTAAIEELEGPECGTADA